MARRCRCNRQRETVVAERALKHGPRGDGLRREKAVTGEEEARVLVGDRERVAIQSVAGAKLAFEVGAPQVVRRGRVGADDARMDRRPPAAAMLDQAAPGEQIGHGARGGPRPNPGMLVGQHLEQLARAPVGVRFTRRDEELRKPRCDRVRAVMWGATAVDQAPPSVGVVPGEPFVADAPTDAVAGAQRAHREAIAERVADEVEAFIHEITLLPGHRRTSLRRVPSSRLRVLPMFPDCFVTHVPRLYHVAT